MKIKSNEKIIKDIKKKNPHWFGKDPNRKLTLETLIADLVTTRTGLRNEARSLAKRSTKTWRDLKYGKMPQEDSIIYSVYEDQSRAEGLDYAAYRIDLLIKEYRVKK